jgi:hypothetical protein
VTDTRKNQSAIDDALSDVFAAARWLGALWNSSAKAVSPNEIEWQCNTWGSGHGRGDWLDTANFLVAAAAFGLSTSQNWEGRDELVVTVPFDQFPRVADLIDRLGDEPEAWPWTTEEEADDDLDGQIAIAAETLKLPRSALAENNDLLEALRIK